jgi:hypothetical protein
MKDGWIVRRRGRISASLVMVEYSLTYLTLSRSSEAGEKIGTTGCFALAWRYTMLICVLLRLLHTGFYFAVQSGGTFDIDYTLTDPQDVVVLEGQGERQGDYILTANKVSMRWRMSLNPSGDGDVVDVALQHQPSSMLTRPVQSPLSFVLVKFSKVGEYSFCFENEASVTSKLIDFE